jgi:hypothetical protein
MSIECGGRDRATREGPATIYDKDILIYCISQLMAKKNAGGTPCPDASFERP